MSKLSINDAYYTKPEIAKMCMTQLLRFVPESDKFIEPSAGCGSFANLIECLAFDTHPNGDNVIEKNFFEVSSDVITDSVVFGNPPFGKNASVAIKFFNHAATNGCKIIAFILPRSFKKESVQRKLNRFFHLIHEQEIPRNSFILQGNEWDVPCVFQIWQRSSVERKYERFTPYVFSCSSDIDEADLFVRRVGAKSGMLIAKEFATKSTTYYIKPNVDKKVLEDALISAYPKLREISKNTAGVRSLSVKEIHDCVTEVLHGRS